MSNPLNDTQKDPWDLLKEAAEKSGDKYKLEAEDFEREWQRQRSKSKNRQNSCGCCRCRCNVKY